MAARARSAVLALGILAGCSAGTVTTTSAGTGNGQTATSAGSGQTTKGEAAGLLTAPGTDSATSGAGQTQSGETGDLIFAKDARQLVQVRLTDGFIKEVAYDQDNGGPHY